MTDFAVTDALFFERTGMEPARIEALVDQSLAGMDDGELYLEYSQSESLALDDGRIKSASFDKLRASVCGRLPARRRAMRTLPSCPRRQSAARPILSERWRAVTRGICAAPSPGTNRSLYAEQNPLGLVDLGAKTRLLAEIDAYARSRDPRVRQVMASLGGVWQAVQIIRPDGRRVADIRPLVRLNVAIVVGDGDRMETGSSGAGGRVGYDLFVDPQQWKAQVDEALRQALVNLGSVPAPAGEMTVVLGPGWPGGHAARGGRPRARGRLQPQEDIGFLWNDWATRCERGCDGRRRRDNSRPAWLADC